MARKFFSDRHFTFGKHPLITKLVVAALALEMMWAVPVRAQTALLPCPAAEPSIESLQSRTSCLDERIRELDQSQRILRDSFNQVFKQLEDLGIEIKGPPKLIEPIPSVAMAVTYAYWENGGGAAFECAPLADKPGYAVWGAQMLPPDVPLREPTYHGQFPNPGNLKQFGAETKAGCSKLWKDRTVEWYSAMPRAAGCYINIEWLEWFRQKSDSVETYETICQ